MLSEKIKKITKDMEFYLKLRGIKYEIKIRGEEVLFFIFQSFLPDKDYDISITPIIALEKNFMNIVVRVNHYIIDYDEILPVLNELSLNTIFKYYINTALNQIESVYVINELDFFIPNEDRTEYIWNILSQMVLAFQNRNIFSRLFS